MALTTAAGYSATPLPRKLGLKAGQVVAFVALPDALTDLTEAVPFARVTRADGWDEPLDGGPPYDLIHAFSRARQDLSSGLPSLRAAIKPDGVIWISWPKTAAKVPTDVNENIVRELALKNGLVDVKVCAVDHVWSGLKLVIPKALRGRGARG